MNLQGDSLSGQNKDGRIAGAGSSPALPAKLRTKLWKRLRLLDRKCGDVDYAIRCVFSDAGAKRADIQYKQYDGERFQIRRQLKGYHP